MLRDRHHGKVCPYCFRPMDRGNAKLMPTRDHIMPISRGGTAKIICCQTCNGIKADMLPDAWTAFMEENPRWWTLSRVELRIIKRQALGLQPRRSRRLRYLQGTQPALPVVVPPQLVWKDVHGNG